MRPALTIEREPETWQCSDLSPGDPVLVRGSRYGILYFDGWLEQGGKAPPAAALVRHAREPFKFPGRPPCERIHALATALIRAEAAVLSAPAAATLPPTEYPQQYVDWLNGEIVELRKALQEAAEALLAGCDATAIPSEVTRRQEQAAERAEQLLLRA